VTPIRVGGRRALGGAGERAAERLLRRAGLVVLARNWRGSGGEIDLAALEGETIVFVEVKSRAEAFPAEYPAIRAAQRRRIVRAARAFRGRYGVEHHPYRFDLVTVEGDPDEPGAVVWHRRQPRVQELA